VQLALTIETSAVEGLLAGISQQNERGKIKRVLQSKDDEYAVKKLFHNVSSLLEVFQVRDPEPLIRGTYALLQFDATISSSQLLTDSTQLLQRIREACDHPPRRCTV
jgi:hypothetical protein